MQTKASPYKIAITGGIGSGKSVVSRLLRMMGAPVYDCDTEAKRLMNSDISIQTALRTYVGDHAYDIDGHLNRSYLSSYIFEHPERVAVVNSIVHPAVRKDFIRWSTATQASTVFVETAILYESGIDADIDAVLLVYAPLNVRIQRALQRDKSSEQDIRKRIEAQTLDEDLLLKASHIIFNDGSTSLISQTQRLLDEISRHRV